MAKPKILMVYNLDPSRTRGGMCGGEAYRIPPLGSEGENPMAMDEAAAKHIVRTSESSDVGTRCWLTLDAELHKAKLAEFEKHGKVMNPQDPTVIADRENVWIGEFTMDRVTGKPTGNYAVRREGDVPATRVVYFLDGDTPVVKETFQAIVPPEIRELILERMGISEPKNEGKKVGKAQRKAGGPPRIEV